MERRSGPKINWWTWSSFQAAQSALRARPRDVRKSDDSPDHQARRFFGNAHFRPHYSGDGLSTGHHSYIEARHATDDGFDRSTESRGHSQHTAGRRGRIYRFGTWIG